MRDLFYQLQPLFEEPGDGEGGSATNSGADTEQPKTFTQDQLEAIVKDRLARESKKYAGIEAERKELEALRKADKERKEAEMSEMEKLTAKLAEKEARISELASYKTELENWEKRESEAIVKLCESSGLSEPQIALVNVLPLELRRDAIDQFKVSDQKPSKSIAFGKSGTAGQKITRQDVVAMATEKGYDHPDVAAAWKELRKSGG